MSTPQEKGTALEIAVHAIESAILRSVPGLLENTFRIEQRKIVTVNGVHHEIDIWVSVDLGSGYHSVFIFECRNRSEKVDKNDIIIFSEKIKAFEAQRGFFVAKSFTADSEAQAAHDPRITLLRVKDLETDGVPMPFGFHGLNVEATEAYVTLIRWGADESAAPTPVESAAVWIVDGHPTPLNEYVDAWINNEREKRVNTFPSGTAAAGTHSLDFEAERTFEPGQATLDGVDVATMRLRGTVRVRVVLPTVVSHFEVATRGRAFTVRLAIGGGQEVTVAFAAVPTPPATSSGTSGPAGLRAVFQT